MWDKLAQLSLKKDALMKEEEETKALQENGDEAIALRLLELKTEIATVWREILFSQMEIRRGDIPPPKLPSHINPNTNEGRMQSMLFQSEYRQLMRMKPPRIDWDEVQRGVMSMKDLDR